MHAGSQFWVKYHFHSKQGVKNLTAAEAETLAGRDADYHRRDLFEAISWRDFPSWTVSVQIMPVAEAKTYRFNPFDLTKTWSHKDYPLVTFGEFTLTRNPTNYFAEIEQAAFSPGNLVPGIGLSPDKMLLGRAFAYHDAALRRIGTNFHQLPVNAPRVPTNSYMFDGHMTYHYSGNRPVYAPNSAGRVWSETSGRADDGWLANGELTREASSLHTDDDDFGQAGALVRDVMDEEQRARLVETVVRATDGVRSPVLERVVAYWKQIDNTVGEQVEAALKLRAKTQ